MRTKALLGLAALAAGALTAAAQSNVYSLNVVGYYNLPLAANKLYLIANQLNTTNNTLAGLLPVVADGTQLYKYSGKYTTYTYDELSASWGEGATATMNPGEGAFIRSPVAATLTFVGEVMQGSQSVTVPINTLVLRSSIVPQAGKLTTFNFPAEDGDQVYQYTTKYTTSTFDGLGGVWDPDLTFAVGEGMFVRKASTSTQSTWTRNFTVQ